jgi:MFS family permease
VALANAVVADIVTSSERGIYVSYTSVAPQVGPSLGPIIGGLLAQYVGWHFIFWFLVILAGVVSVPMAVFFPETCRKVVGDGSIPPVKWNRCCTNYINESRAIKMGKSIPWEKRDELARKRHIRVPNPFSVLTIIVQKSCGYPLFYTALVCSGVYATAALIPSQFGTIYNFNELQIALCYIPLGAGSMLAAFVRGRMIDARFRYHAKRLNMPIVHNRRACWNCSCRGHTSWLHNGFTLRVYSTGLLYGFYTRFLYSGNLFGTIVLIFCLYIGGQLPFKLIIKQLKQFNLFYAAHISLLLL